MKKLTSPVRLPGAVLVLFLMFACVFALRPLQACAEGDTSEPLPDWVVSDPDSFERFHNENAPKVVDDADLFTDAEEAAIAAKIQPLVDQYEKDLVVYTNLSSYGYERNVFGADFYVYNGYGIGENYDGMVLYICMDPADREYQTVAFGSARDALTQQNGSTMDDVLASWFTDGKYADGVLAWLDCVDTLYHYGVPALPQWYKDALDGTLSSTLKDTKIINELGTGLSAEKEAEYLDLIARYRETYGVDVVIWLTDRCYELDGEAFIGSESLQKYCDTFWETVGFGAGETKAGVLLAFFRDESFIYNVQVRSYGDADTRLRFSEKVNQKLADLTSPNINAGQYEENIGTFLNYLGRFLRTHHLPMDTGIKVLCAFLCVAAGLIFGFISTAAADKKMKTVKIQTTAADALVAGSFQVLRTGKQLTGSHTVRTYNVRSRSSNSGHSGGSGSGHSSSYTSSGKSSSGVSFTSSGRKF